jgi:hypothetical protein
MEKMRDVLWKNAVEQIALPKKAQAAVLPALVGEESHTGKHHPQ